MSSTPLNPLLEKFRDAAERVAAERPEVHRELALEVYSEAADLLHNGLILDSLDAHDANEVTDNLCRDLASVDPGAAIRARAEACLTVPGDLHDPETVANTYLLIAHKFQL